MNLPSMVLAERFTLMESAPDAMVVVGADGAIVFANSHAERLFGFSAHELVGKGIEILVPDRFRSGHRARREGYVHEPRVRPMGAGLELYGRRKDGSEFPVEISLSPVTVPEGVYTVSAIRDISDRKAVELELQEANARLRDANAAKDRFLASMSHELRTPLNAIIGFTGTLLMKLPGPLTSDQEHQLRIVQSSARHLLSLINDILDLAKIESGKAELFFEPVDVSEVVGEVLESMRSLAKEKGLVIRTAVADNARSPIVSDRRALHQILINLVNNAIKYTHQGSVVLDVHQVELAGKQYLQLSVVDTGIGIKPEDQERLFQAFEQLDTSSTRRFEGVGLGLYLCDKLANLIGAKIDFESVYERGSTFRVTLPPKPESP